MSDLIILANGCFDCFHYGHLDHLKKASLIKTRYRQPYPGRLVVAVTVDSAVNKGAGRPVFPLVERMEMIRQLRFVDDVVISESGLQAIQVYRPYIYVKGRDWEGKLQAEGEAMTRLGGYIEYTDPPLYSSTKILTGELLRERIEAAGRSKK